MFQKTTVRLLFVIICFSQFCFKANGQTSKLKSGFSQKEYAELLKISAKQGDAPYDNKLSDPENFYRVYKSTTLGFNSRWELWSSKNAESVISIHGTGLDLGDWTENFFSPMLPAKGTIRLSEYRVFNYNLSNNPKAAVHAKWLISAICLFEDIMPKIESAMQNGIYDFYITGHNQGGAIAYFITSMIQNAKSTNVNYEKLNIKTYTSGSPKPGNLHFAYEYEATIKKGWTFNVVNTADWVPEGPFSIASTNDYNSLNPFKELDVTLDKVAFPKNVILKRSLDKIDKPVKKSIEKYRIDLHSQMASQFNNYFPGSSPLEFHNCTNYTRAGETVVLYANDAYYADFKESKNDPWLHHRLEAYAYLNQQ